MNLTTRARDQLRQIQYFESYHYLKETLSNCMYSSDYDYVTDLIEHGALLVNPADKYDNFLHSVLKVKFNSGSAINKGKWQSKIAEIIEALLNNGLDLCLPNEVNETAFHVVDKNEDLTSSNKIMERFGYCFRKQICTYQGLQNIVDVNGVSLFHLLCKLSRPSTIVTFLKIVPNINVNDAVPFNSKLYPGFTPLHFAVVFENNDNVRELVDPMSLQDSYGRYSAISMDKLVNVNAQDFYGNTALHYYTDGEKINQMYNTLLQMGADIYIKNEEGWSVYDRLRTMRNQFDLNDLCEHLLKLKICYGNFSEIDFLNDWIAYNISKKTYYAEYEFKRFRAACEREVDKMKKTEMVKHYVSLHDVLVKNINKVASYTKLEELREMLEYPGFTNEFPLYGNLLRARFVRGLARKSLLEDVKDAFRCLARLNIPEACIDAITSYLSEKKLRDIIEAAGQSKCVSISDAAVL